MSSKSWTADTQTQSATAAETTKPETLPVDAPAVKTPAAGKLPRTFAGER